MSDIFKDILVASLTSNLLELIDDYLSLGLGEDSSSLRLGNDSSSLDESKTPFGLIKDLFVKQNSVFRNNQAFLNDQESWSNEKWFIRERRISLVKL